MTVLKGVLKAPTGQLMANAYIVLFSKANTSVMIKGLKGEFQTNNAGYYSFECPIGVYEVWTRSYTDDIEYAGQIIIGTNDPDGPINNYLNALDPGDLTPDVVRQVMELAAQAAQSAQDAAASAAMVTEVTELANQAAASANNAADRRDEAQTAAAASQGSAQTSANQATAAINAKNDAQTAAATATQGAQTATSAATAAQGSANDARRYQIGTIYKKVVINVSASQTTALIDLAAGTEFVLNLSNVNPCALTFANANTDTDLAQQFTLDIKQVTGANLLTYPNTVKWQNGKKPKLSWDVGKEDTLTFSTKDNGASWKGYFSGQGF
nr:MAG: putative tail fiber [Bacteriophage sp.]